jgi:hypothetical protein
VICDNVTIGRAAKAVWLGIQAVQNTSSAAIQQLDDRQRHLIMHLRARVLAFGVYNNKKCETGRRFTYWVAQPI